MSNPYPYANTSTGEPLPRQPLDTLTAIDLAKLRTIIASVIADGPWEFTCGADSDVRDYEREQRLVMVETIILRIIATAAPSVKGTL